MALTTKNAIPPFERRWALFLDVDGTLLDFVDRPNELKAPPELIELLRDLERLTRGAIVLVSGRAIASVDDIFDPLRLPTAGLHGHERRDTRGRVHRAPADDGPLSLARRRFDELVGRHTGTFIEDKGPAIAFHFRQAPTAAAEAEQLASELERELPQPFCVQRGKMVVEVRSCEHSKGSAIAAFMREPELHNRVPVFVGDDATDEYGFQWVNDHSSMSIKVGGGESSARFRMSGVTEVVAWLEDYARYLQSGEGVPKHVS